MKSRSFLDTNRHRREGGNGDGHGNQCWSNVLNFMLGLTGQRSREGSAPDITVTAFRCHMCTLLRWDLSLRSLLVGSIFLVMNFVACSACISSNMCSTRSLCYSICGIVTPTALANRRMLCACFNIGASIISLPPLPSFISKPNAPL